MERPDFKEIRRLTDLLEKLDASFEELFTGTEALEMSLKDLCGEVLFKQARESLKAISVDELKNSKAGIRTQALLDAGYRTLYDLSELSDEEMTAIQGIGEKQAAQIRLLTEEFQRNLVKRERIRLSGDENDAAGMRLLTALARFRKADEVKRDADGIRREVHDFIAETLDGIRIRSGLRWIFSRRGTRRETLRAINRLSDYCAGSQFGRVSRFISLYGEAAGMDEAGALSDFRRNSASYYAILENITGETADSLIYSSIPSGMAAEISKTELNLRGFKGTLRPYQKFGAQYVLHQGKVLLGDEMGLGKTIQAIAVMAHLYANGTGSRFLVVCPASVMINWCREIRKFSDIPAFLLHGETLEDTFSGWEAECGAAVTNYESMRKILGKIDNRMRLSLLVVDEAHYIKNPSAQRTKNVRALGDESERILMMSGTPLENKVYEMCELIDFVRPDLTNSVREYMGMRQADAFREMISPVYLRRRAEQVLTELPPLTVSGEWCTMTEEDSRCYREEIRKKNFMGMRRVSFLQDEMALSSKAVRLKELCEEAAEEGKKVLVYSYFRDTLRKVRDFLGSMCAGEITGSTPVPERQAVVDRFTESTGGSILLCQIQSGGTGLNIQAASVVIFCEPQIKPSLEKQAAARARRMGQLSSVLVCRLLCENTVDEAVLDILEEKQQEFNLYADESAAAEAADRLADADWIQGVIEAERLKYLPAVVEG